MYTRCCADLEILRTEQEVAQERSAASEEDLDEEEPTDRDAALDGSDDEEEAPAVPAKRRRKVKGKQKPLTALELHDKRYFLEYITTDKCRRLNVCATPYPPAPGPCCDNCDPESFEVETIALVGGPQLKAGRKATSSPELEAAVRKKLNELRDEIVAADFPSQLFLTAK
ncbi:hypothetical protein B0H13DRAFT_2333200 [Mycena leptocephala]|nr:hypothetical protein B0H13DRAFT_2333200 [Mycena leptocephala]